MNWEEFKNTNLGILALMAAVTVIVIVLLIFLIGDSNDEGAAVQEESTAEVSEEVITEEEESQLDTEDALPKYEEVVDPKKTEEMKQLKPGIYKNVRLVIDEDSVITGNLGLSGVYLELKGNGLTFASGSSIEIKDSVIANAGGLSNGIKIEKAAFSMDKSAVLDSEGHGLNFEGTKNAAVRNSQFFDNQWSAVRAVEAENLNLVNNKFISNGCLEPLTGRKRQYCIRDGVSHSSVDIKDLRDGINFANNKVTSYLKISGNAEDLEIENNEFLGKGGIKLVSDRATGIIEFNTIKTGSIDLNIQDANGLKIEQNEIGVELVCRSSDSIVHNWADILGLNFVGGEELIGHCSKLE